MRSKHNTLSRRIGYLPATGAAIVAAATALCALSACDSNDPDNPDIASHVYQEYAVEANDMTVTASANLRRGNAEGECVRLSGRSALFANDREMTYQVPMHGEQYTYTTMLPRDTQSVEFRLKVSDSHSIVNTAELGYVAAVRLAGETEGEPYTVTEGSLLKADVTGLEMLTLSASVTSTMPLGTENWSCAITVSGDVLITPALKPGRYILTLTSSTRIPTQHNDSPASGSIRISRSTTRTLVVTANES